MGMDGNNYPAEQQYLAGEREAELQALMADPETYVDTPVAEPNIKVRGASA